MSICFFKLVYNQSVCTNKLRISSAWCGSAVLSAENSSPISVIVRVVVMSAGDRAGTLAHNWAEVHLGVGFFLDRHDPMDY